MRTVCTLSLAIALSLWSLFAIATDILSQPYRVIAEKVEAGTVRDAGYLARLDRRLKKNPAASACSRELVRSAVSIRLAVLDTAYGSGDAKAAANALSEADRTVRAGLQCFPQDGNLWLRLAMLEFAQRGPTADVETMLGLSASTAPNEAWIMAPRIAFTAKLLEYRAAGLEDDVRRDVQRYVAHARPPDIASLYRDVNERASPLFLDAVAGLKKERRGVVEAAIREMESALPPERRP